MNGNSNHKKLGSARLNVEAFKQVARQFSRRLPGAVGVDDADRFQALVALELPLMNFDPLAAGPLDGLGYHSDGPEQNVTPPGDSHGFKAPGVPGRSPNALKKRGTGQSSMTTASKESVSLEKADRVVPEFTQKPVVSRGTGRKKHSPARPENGSTLETSHQGQGASVDKPPKDRMVGMKKGLPEERSRPRKTTPVNKISHRSSFQPALRQLNDLSNAILEIKGGLAGGATQGNVTPENPEDKSESRMQPLGQDSNLKSFNPLQKNADQDATLPASVSSNGQIHPQKKGRPGVNSPGRETPRYRVSSNVQGIRKNNPSETRSIELIASLVKHPPADTHESGPGVKKITGGIHPPAAMRPNLEQAKAKVPAETSKAMNPRGTGVSSNRNPMPAGTARHSSHFTAETLTDLINDVLISQARRHGVDV